MLRRPDLGISQFYTRVLSTSAKRSVHEVFHSHPSNAEVKDLEYLFPTSTTQLPVVNRMHRDFTFTSFFAIVVEEAKEFAELLRLLMFKF